MSITDPIGEPGGESSHLETELAAGESGFCGWLSPGIVLFRLPSLGLAAELVGLGGWRVPSKCKCNRGVLSKFLFIDRVFCGDTGAGVGSREGGWGSAWSFLLIVARRWQWRSATSYRREASAYVDSLQYIAWSRAAEMSLRRV